MRRGEVLLWARSIAFAHQHEWRDLWLAVLSVVLLALAAPGIGGAATEQKNQTEEPDLAALPQEVRQALVRAARMYPQPLSGARWSEVSRLKGTDHPLYQLRGTNGRGNKIEIEVTSAGRIIEVEEHGIPLGEVPTAVLEALKARMPHAEPAQVEAIYQAGQAKPVCYGFEGTDAAGRAIEVYISADGKTFLN